MGVARAVALCCSVVLLCVFVNPANGAAKLRLCEDDNYAPFAYADPSGRHALQGATIDLVRSLLAHAGAELQIDMLPWARCLAYVKDGTYQIGMDAYYDENRSRFFVYSKPYYTLTPQYYYSRSRYPAGLKISQRADLKKYRGCGIHDYSYAHYGLNDGDIAANVENHGALVRKIKGGRCDYFVEELEVMQGFALNGEDFLADPDLGHGSIADVPAPQLHFIMAKNSVLTAWLLPLLNQQIDRQRNRMRQLVLRRLSLRH